METLRKNNVLTLAEDIQNYIYNRKILRSVHSLDKLIIQQGIVIIKNDKEEQYLSHKYVYALENGLSLAELLSVLKFEVLRFEEKHGKYIETESNINALRNIAYKYNRALAAVRNNQPSLEMINSSFILYYVGVNVNFNFTDEVLTLTFGDGKRRVMDPTIFTEMELRLLTHVQNRRMNLLELEK